jgi:hypothetical protein
MSGQQGSVRKRKDASVVGKSKDTSATDIAPPRDADLDALVKANLEIKSAGVEWDYRIAISVITLLAFITRFWGISHPNEVVFDEVHFGKVTISPPPKSPNPTYSANNYCSSLPPTISSERISSMSILLSESYFSR